MVSLCKPQYAVNYKNMTVIFLCLSLKLVLKIRYEKTRVEFIPCKMIKCLHEGTPYKTDIAILRQRSGIMGNYKEKVIALVRQIDDESFLKKLYYLILANKNRVGR